MAKGLRLLLVLLVLAEACGCRSTKASSPAVVPWVNRPVPLYATPDVKLVRYPTSGPACRSGQLRVSQGREAVGLGNRLERIVFTNTGANFCLLRGYPTITGVTHAGARRTLRPIRGGTYFGRLIPADMAPGDHVFLDLATSSACEGGRKSGSTYRRLVFGLPNGGSVRAGRVSITAVCGLSMSEFGLPERYEPIAPAAGTAGTLRVRVRLPPTVRAGSVLRYTITLVNPTTTTVVFRPCPGYTQTLYPKGPVVHRSFALNCDSVHAIPAHERMRYAMQLPVPRQAVPGAAKFGWSLDTPTGPFVGRVISVTG
jgi:hypothetical protein